MDVAISTICNPADFMPPDVFPIASPANNIAVINTSSDPIPLIRSLHSISANCCTTRTIINKDAANPIKANPSPFKLVFLPILPVARRIAMQSSPRSANILIAPFMKSSFDIAVNCFKANVRIKTDAAMPSIAEPAPFNDPFALFIARVAITISAINAAM